MPNSEIELVSLVEGKKRRKTRITDLDVLDVLCDKTIFTSLFSDAELRSLCMACKCFYGYFQEATFKRKTDIKEMRMLVRKGDIDCVNRFLDEIEKFKNHRILAYLVLYCLEESWRLQQYHLIINIRVYYTFGLTMTQYLKKNQPDLWEYFDNYGRIQGGRLCTIYMTPRALSPYRL